MWVPWSWFLGHIYNTGHVYVCPPVEWALNPTVLGFPHSIHATGASMRISCHTGHYYSLLDWSIRLNKTVDDSPPPSSLYSTVKASQKRGNFQFSSNWIFPCPMSHVSSMLYLQQKDLTMKFWSNSTASNSDSLYCFGGVMRPHWPVTHP